MVKGKGGEEEKERRGARRRRKEGGRRVRKRRAKAAHRHILRETRAAIPLPRARIGNDEWGSLGHDQSNVKPSNGSCNYHVCLFPLLFTIVILSSFLFIVFGMFPPPLNILTSTPSAVLLCAVCCTLCCRMKPKYTTYTREKQARSVFVPVFNEVCLPACLPVNEQNHFATRAGIRTMDAEGR